MNTISSERSEPSATVVIALGILNALTPFTIDLYLPAFADIASDLRTDVPSVSLSVATYFIGFALGQVIYGPLLDRFGRKPPILVGLILYVIATLGCLRSQTIHELLVFRFFQALGGSAASVGAMTMVRDLFPPNQTAKVFSVLMLVLSVSPLFAPTMGGWMAAHQGWRFIFAVLAALAVANFIIVCLLPKTRGRDPSVSLKIVPVLRTFREVLRIPSFRTYTIAGALSFAGMFVFVTGSPAVFIDGFGVSKQGYGLIFALIAGGMIAGGQINNLLMKRASSQTIFRRAMLFQLIMGALFLASVLIFDLGLEMTIAFLFFIISSMGIGYPNAASLALEKVTANVGSASALLGFLQMGFGAVLSSLVGLISARGSVSTALVMCISACLGWFVLNWSKTEVVKDPSSI